MYAGKLPTIEHPTDQPNFTLVHLGEVGGDITLAFSYTTVVGFHVLGAGWTVHENIWTTTTNRHLNYLDQGRKGGRVDADTFARALADTLGGK